MTEVRDKLLFSVVLHALFIAVLMLTGNIQNERSLFLTVSLTEEKNRKTDGQTIPLPLTPPSKEEQPSLLTKPETQNAVNPGMKKNSDEKAFGTSVPQQKAAPVHEGIFKEYLATSAPSADRAEPVGSDTQEGASQKDKPQAAQSVSVRDSSGYETDSGAFLISLRRAIEKALVYPPVARMRRMEGTVIVGFSISRQGAPENIRITKSSGFEILDSAAEKTIVKASPFPGVAGRIEIPITFRLEKGR